MHTFNVSFDKVFIYNYVTVIECFLEVSESVELKKQKQKKS